MKLSSAMATKLSARRSQVALAWVIAVVLTLAAAIGAGWWMMARTAHIQYVTVPVGNGPVTRFVTATGTVNPVLTIVVGTYVSGIIQNLYCDYNTKVRPGQVCAKIDPRPYRATLDQYSAQLLRDRAVDDKDKADLVRYQKLAAENAIARQQAEDQVFVVAQDDATVKLDEALVEGARLNLAYTDIISPVQGTVVSRNVTGGQTVAASFQTPTLFLIATDLKQMEVDTNSSEGDMGGIRQGDAATFTVDAFPERIFKGRVSQVRQSPQTVQNVVTYDVVIGVDNDDLALMPGMTASTQIVVAHRENVLRVPNQALRYVPGGLSTLQTSSARMPSGRTPEVWVLRDGKPVAVAITRGLADDSFTEITKGELNSGDQVITAEISGQGGGQPAPPPPRL